MKKALLEINMPKSCTDCRLCFEDTFCNLICTVTNENVSEYSKCRSKKCKLKGAY